MEILYNKVFFGKNSSENNNLTDDLDDNQLNSNLNNYLPDQIQDDFNSKPIEWNEYNLNTEVKKKKPNNINSNNDSEEKYLKKLSKSDSKATNIHTTPTKVRLEKETNCFQIEKTIQKQEIKINKPSNFYSLIFKSCFILSLAMFLWDFHMKYKESEMKLEIQKNQWKSVLST